MNNYQNEGALDRFVRLLISLSLFLGAYFWVGGVWQVVLFVFSAVSFGTAVVGSCLLYKVFGVNTIRLETKPLSVYTKGLLIFLLLVVALVGSYYSVFFTKKFFLEDFNEMNNFYKQTLFYTGQGMRAEAKENYDNLLVSFASFQDKYATYRPYSLRADTAFTADLQEVSQMILSQKEPVDAGDLGESHLSFEAIRPIFQDILKRNNFSLLSVALVDFHDSMEKIIAAADAKDANQVMAAYDEVDSKLKEVEAILNDDEIQIIRMKLEETRSLAEAGEVDSLSAKASELKSAFVKVYLKRG